LGEAFLSERDANAVRNDFSMESQRPCVTRRETIDVTGMSCGGCERAVENALRNVEGVCKADADYEAGTVAVVTDATSDAALEDAVRGAGFGVEG
jgi:copper chaperone